MSTRAKEIEKEIYKLKRDLRETRNEKDKAIINDKIMKLNNEYRSINSKTVADMEVKPCIDAPSLADKREEGHRGQVIATNTTPSNMFGLNI